MQHCMLLETDFGIPIVDFSYYVYRTLFFGARFSPGMQELDQGVV